eukprot:gene13061-14405_t
MPNREKVIDKRFEKDALIPYGLAQLTATGNGDCLFNSVGKLLFGTEVVSPILRLVAAAEGIRHWRHYVEEYRERFLTRDSALQMLYSMSTPGVYENRPSFSRATASDVLKYTIQSEIMEITKEKSFSGLLHVRFLATLNEPINVMFVSVGKSPFPNHYIPLVWKVGKRASAPSLKASVKERMCAASKKLGCHALVGEKEEWVFCKRCKLCYHAVCSGVNANRKSFICCIDEATKDAIKNDINAIAIHFDDTFSILQNTTCQESNVFVADTHHSNDIVEGRKPHYKIFPRDNILAHELVIFPYASSGNGLPPIRGTTFKQYASDKFLPFLGQKLRDVKRLDVVFDVYVKDSLKSTARSHRGEGSRKRVKDNYIVPANWNSFLRHSDNKTELFSYLANFSHQNLKNGEKSFAITIGSEVLTLPPQDTSIISPCNHEEADSRMYLHLYDAITRQNMQNAVIKTVDTDVMVLGVAAVVRIRNLKLYIAFGSGKTFRYINVNEVSQFLGSQRSLALPMFHSLTGCDTVSFLAGRGNKTAMDIWNSYEDLTEALLQVMNHPGTEINECFAIIEQFIVYLYDRGSTLESVNATRQMLFSHKNRTLENIPPSQGALKQHILRASYQANIWNQMLSNLQVLPEPEMCGWEKVDEYWQPVWTTLPEVADAISILVKCNCKKGCKNACKCKKGSLNCTAMCFCGGDCN